jgi:RNA polymerase sigma-70 factor, ECF subfamily
MGAAVSLPGLWRFSPGGRASTSAAPSPTPAARIQAVTDASDLVTRCRAGSAEAFRELFRAHREDVARLAYRMTGNASDLEDLVQEVFLQVHRSIGDFRGDARFSTWLYRLTVNVVLMHRRAAKSRPQLVGESLTTQPKDQRMLPDDQLIRQRRILAFQRLVLRLSEKKQTVFVLHELEGHSPAEIAKIVGAPVLTVRTRLFYARREILAMIREEPALAGLVAEEAAELVPTEEST